MRRVLSFCLLACLPLVAQQAPIPTATAVSGEPFFIKKTWPIGGNGNWDYLTIDPAAERLYIAHGRGVQVVDLESGSVAGEIGGFREAHAIALDDIGQYGYISDGPANAIAVFNRRTLKIGATISIGCAPRSIAFEPQSKLVFAVCGSNVVSSSTPPPDRRAPNSSRAPRAPGSADQEIFTGVSHVIVIDTQANAAIADVAVAGDFRFAQADGAGAVYVTVAQSDRPENLKYGISHRIVAQQRIAKFDGSAIATEAKRLRHAAAATAPGSPVFMDWSESDNPARPGFTSTPLPSACKQPQGFAVDSRHQRIFVACDNQQFVVLDSGGGNVVTTLTTGPGDDVIGYDADRGLLYSANGGGYGSLTIIQQDANTDSYSVIQNLPTMERARTLAVDPSTGQVYLVTDLHGVDLTKMGGIGTLRSNPIPGSFQVIVIGH
jgi:DNA-binding beta-propeller fold protein YncE